MRASSFPEAGWRHVAGAVLGLTTLLTVLLVAFTWPTSQLEPRQLPVAVAGPPPVVEQVSAGLASGPLGEDALDVTVVASRAEAVAAIEQREVYGAVVASAGAPEVLVASAASPAVAQMLAETAGQATAQDGAPAQVTDVVPLPDDDTRGAVFSAGALPLVIGGIATGAVLALRIGTRTQRAAGAAALAVTAGAAMAGVLQGWFGALEGSYLANAGVYALAIGAIAVAVTGLHNLAGMVGIGLGAATMLLLGNPLSGITSAPELLPSGWGVLGQLLPPGAAGSALRSTAFFDGAGSMTPLLVLTGWVLVGLVLTLLPLRRRAEQARARRTDTDFPSVMDPSHAA